MARGSPGYLVHRHPLALAWHSVGADALIGLRARPHQLPRQRQRGQKDRPFDNHPEISTSPTIAAQDPRN